MSTDTSTDAALPSSRGVTAEELDLQSLRRDVVVAVERLRDVDEARLGVILDALDAHAEVVHDGGLEVDRARGGSVLGGRVGERNEIVRVPVDLVELLYRRVHRDDLLAAFSASVMIDEIVSPSSRFWA